MHLVPGLRRPRVWIGLAAAGLALSYGVTLGDFGSPQLEDEVTETIYLVIVLGAAIACIVRAFSVRCQRAAWALIGGGLAAWGLGDLWFWFGPNPNALLYPWVTNGLFVALYPAALTGLFVLTIKPLHRHSGTLSLGIALLGLATLWCWVVFGAMLHEGNPTIAATLAYPLLDVAIVGAVVVGHATNRWRPDPPLLALGAGFLLIGLADVIYAVQVANDSYVANTLLDSLWPTGALFVGAAPWLDERLPRPHRAEGDMLPIVLAACAVLAAAGVLVADHFVRVPVPTLILAAATIVVAVLKLVVIQRHGGQAEVAAQESARRAVSALAATVDAKDHYTHNHSLRVSAYALTIAAGFEMDEDTTARVADAGRLHDVGKIAIPDDILLKPTRLTKAEFERVKEHSAEGERIVRVVGLVEEAGWIRHLHERWDGRGYPDGLRGEEIPIESRVLAVADAIDAMTTDRAYRARRSTAEVARELLDCSGAQFDARVVSHAAALLADGSLRIEPEHAPATGLHVA
ncbi:MAG: hypothetical protein QOH58_1606 [Thermoleophilaceae bacterium]|jgi:hypothetical protein|nr:hypothetical protein [Thermoleophilaceae bacterium]